MKTVISLLLVTLILIFQRGAGYAVQPMLPGVYQGQIDVAGWLMSEKLDGVRGYWDGSCLYSKNGYRFNPPEAFVAGLPAFSLEGEIWAGRGRFEDVAAIVKSAERDQRWLQLQFGVFDVPMAEGSFVDRIDMARKWFAAHPSPYAFVIEQIPVRDEKHLKSRLAEIEALGGEGLIVRQPGARYESGRSAAILKVKSYQDAEATVLAYYPGGGRHEGRLGAMLVRMADGTQFKIGTGFSDRERESPPAIGTLITFRYYGRYRSGIPRFPSFIRVRQDRGL